MKECDLTKKNICSNKNAALVLNEDLIVNLCFLAFTFP
jgi:hypothetical protein